MPSIVPSRTNQSSAFMRSGGKRLRATSRPERKRRTQTSRPRANGGSPARPGIHRWRVRAAMTSFAEGNQICKQPVSPRHAGGKFAEKHEAGVNEIAFAILRDEQSAF